MTKRTTLPAVATLQAHAHDLAVAFQARLIESADLRPEEAFAHAGLRAAFVATIVDETTYAVALHELGHLAAPTGVLRLVVRNGNPVRLARDEEDAAWAWARHYALIWTDVMEHVARWAEDSYKSAGTPPAEPPAPVVPNQIDWKKWSQ